jgi:hypothetical protein
MRRTPITIAAAACSGLLAVGLVAAPSASAYPPGKDQKTKVNKEQVRPDGKLKPQVRNAQPGCRARFEVVNKGGKVVVTRKTSKDNGVGQDGRVARTLRMPKKPGNYTIRTTIFGAGCLKASSSANVTVG